MRILWDGQQRHCRISFFKIKIILSFKLRMSMVSLTTIEPEKRWFFILIMMFILHVLGKTSFVVILYLNKHIRVIFNSILFFFFRVFIFNVMGGFAFMMVSFCCIEECALVEIRSFPSKWNCTECFRPKSWVVSSRKSLRI